MTNVIKVNFNQKALNAGLNSISRYEALTNEIAMLETMDIRITAEINALYYKGVCYTKNQTAVREALSRAKAEMEGMLNMPITEI